MVVRGGMREASCSDTDAGLAPMSSLRIISVQGVMLVASGFGMLVVIVDGWMDRGEEERTGWCFRFSIGSIEELVCFASELSQAFASCGRSCGSAFVKSDQPLLCSKSKHPPP